MPVTALQEMNMEGAFIRSDSVYRDLIEEGGDFPPEAHRYHLYIALACPWANGVLAAVHLLGLEDIISVSICHPTWARTNSDDETDLHCGWQFKKPGDSAVSNTEGYGSFDCDDALIPDPHFNANYIREIYEKCTQNSHKGGKYTTPILFDIKQKRIVCNESTLILRSLNSKGFYKLSKHYDNTKANTNTNAESKREESENEIENENQIEKRARRFNLYPPEYESVLLEMNEFIYPFINNGVYRCGFATSQIAYETAFDELFNALDRCEEILSQRRYICASPEMTAMDLRLFMTLIRFDEVYFIYFKTNKKSISRDYPNLFNYLIDIYQHRGIGDRGMVNMKHIKMHYFTSHPNLNRYGVIPKGNDIDYMTLDHNRHEMK